MKFEISKPMGGRPETYYVYNEKQATLLMTYMGNSDHVLDFKDELVDEFFRMKELLGEKTTELWQTIRINGKEVRKELTNVIGQQLIPYAISQGYNANKTNYIYSNYTRMINNTLAIKQLPHGITREFKDFERLHWIKQAENVVALMISDGIARNLPYNDIFTGCKLQLKSLQEQGLFE